MKTSISGIEKAVSTIKYLTTGATSFFTALVLERLKDSQSFWERFVLALILVILLLWFLSWVGGQFLEKFHWLRKKLFGRAYVEGAWIDISYTKTGGNEVDKVVNAAISRFYYADGALKGDGTAFDPNGNSLGHFDILSIEYTDERLQYAFVGDMSISGKSGSTYGYGSVRFGTRGDADAPVEYTGYYIDSGRRRQFEIRGWILTGVDARKILKLDVAAKGNEVKSRIADFLQQNPSATIGTIGDSGDGS